MTNDSLNQILCIIRSTLDAPTFIDPIANCKNLTKSLQEIECIALMELAPTGCQRDWLDPELCAIEDARRKKESAQLSEISAVYKINRQIDIHQSILNTHSLMPAQFHEGCIAGLIDARNIMEQSTSEPVSLARCAEALHECVPSEAIFSYTEGAKAVLSAAGLKYVD